MTVINLTPHPITLIRKDGTEITHPPSGTVAKVTTEEFTIDEIDGVPTIARRFGKVVGLPESPSSEDVLIVSSMVLSAVEADEALLSKYWEYVFAPDTGSTARRDGKGQVSGVTRLVTCYMKE